MKMPYSTFRRSFVLKRRLHCTAPPKGYRMHYESSPQPRRYCFGRELFANGASAWLRVSDIAGVHFESDTEAGHSIQHVEGTVRGAISNAAASVFLVWRIARQCFSMSGTDGVSKGNPIPPCDEPYPPAQNWQAREAVVDAAGNWSAKMGPDDATLRDEGPWVEFWQVQAIATFERQAFADRITPSGTISEADVRQFAHLLCSDPRVNPHSIFFNGFWRQFEPTKHGWSLQMIFRGRA